jgi:hypothetical protein
VWCSGGVVCCGITLSRIGILARKRIGSASLALRRARGWHGCGSRIRVLPTQSASTRSGLFASRVGRGDRAFKPAASGCNGVALRKKLGHLARQTPSFLRSAPCFARRLSPSRRPSIFSQSLSLRSHLLPCTEPRTTRAAPDGTSGSALTGNSGRCRLLGFPCPVRGLSLFRARPSPRLDERYGGAMPMDMFDEQGGYRPPHHVGRCDDRAKIRKPTGGA